MAGLLDGIFNTEQGRMGLGLLAAGSARGDGAGFGQRLSEAVGSVDQWKQQQAQAKRMKMQEEYQAFQMQQAMAQAKAQEAEQARLQTIRQGMGGFFKPGQQALAPLMGDSASGIQPSAGRAAVAPSFDTAGAAQFLAQNGEYEKAFSMMPKPKELAVNKLDVKDFTPASVQKFAQSGNYGDLVRMDKLHMGTEGGDFKGRNPFTGEEVVSSKLTKSFSDVNAERNNQLGWANYGLSKERLATEKASGKAAPAGYRWSSDGTSLEAIPGGPAANEKPLTEGQAKAFDFTGRLEQANDVIDKLSGKGVKKGIPFQNAGFGVGSVVNTLMVPGEWQQLDQAKRQWINSALRRESGAVIGADEFANFDKTYFPQVGDGKEVIENKRLARQQLTSGVAADIPSSYRAKMPRYGGDVEAALKKYGG